MLLINFISVKIFKWQLITNRIKDFGKSTSSTKRYNKFLISDDMKDCGIFFKIFKIFNFIYQFNI